MFKRAAAPLAGERAQPADSSSIDGEHEVLEQARHGDVRAWALVVRQHQETVYRVVVLLLGDRITATEVTRTAFIRAFRALPDLAPGTPVRAWLIGIASTIGRAQRRALARAVDRDTKPRIMPLDPRLPPTALPATAQAASLDPDRREDVLAAFDVLSWEERLAIAARYLVGSNRTEAAALLGAEPIAVERSLAAALDHVRSALPDARLASLPPDHLGALVTATVVGQLAWTPNLAPSVADRLVRDAIAYPEQFGSSRRVSTEVDVHRRRRGPLVAGRA